MVIHTNSEMLRYKQTSFTGTKVVHGFYNHDLLSHRVIYRKVKVKQGRE